MWHRNDTGYTVLVYRYDVQTHTAEDKVRPDPHFAKTLDEAKAKAAAAEKLWFVRNTVVIDNATGLKIDR